MVMFRDGDFDELFDSIFDNLEDHIEDTIDYIEDSVEDAIDFDDIDFKLPSYNHPISAYLKKSKSDIQQEKEIDKEPCIIKNILNRIFKKK